MSGPDPARDLAALIERLLDESGEVAEADMGGMMAALHVTNAEGARLIVEVEEA